MKVTLHTYGGLTGFGQPPVTVDDAELAAADRSELRRLVSAAVAATPDAAGQEDADSPLRDAQSYEITVEDADRSDVLAAVDGSVPEDLARLRDWLREHDS